MKKHKIANTVFEFEFISKDYFKLRFKDYELLENEKTQYFLKFELVHKINPAKGKLLKESRTGKRFKANGIIYDDLYIKDEIVTKIIYDNNLITVYLKKGLNEITQREYVISSMLFSEIMKKEKKVVIHASAIKYQNEAILFSAPSGIGKSTQARLWVEYFQDADYINDDKPVLSLEENIFYCYGSPWSGKTSLNNNYRLPLKAIIFLQQAENNSIEKMSSFSKIHNLMTNLGITDREDENNLIIKYCDQLISHIDIYFLKCRIDNEAVEIVHRKLYNLEQK